jgi:hypothetical protein
MGISMAVMAAHVALTPIPGYTRHQIAFANVRTSLIAQSRHSLVEQALIHFRATHILWIDSDQVFPADVIHRLAAHRKMYVGANIVTRKIPMVPSALGLNLEKLWTRPESKGLEQVASIGTGVALLNTKVFAELEVPYFESYFHKDFGRYVGEDVDFCNKMRAKGIPVFVDHDLSKDIEHLGEFAYSFPTAWEQGDLPGAMKEAA